MTPTRRPTFSRQVIGDGGFVYLLASGGVAPNPAPTITSLSPTSATAGGSAFTLTVNGTGYVSTSVVNWNGVARATTFVSATQIQAAILVGDIAASGTGSVTVFNPTPGGGTSSASTFTINAAGINFDFTTGVLPGAITFTRASIGTYVNNVGTLITASNNVARFNYVAGVSNLLIEPSATNLALQSNNFSTAPWTPGSGGVVTPGQFVSPDGTNNGWSLTGAFGYVVQAGVPYSNIQYTNSLWAKWIVGTAPLDMQAGGTFTTLTPTATLTRLSGLANYPPAGAGDLILQINASSGTNGIYGVQLEAGTVPTSYIPTTTAAVTRAADSVVFTIPAGIGHLTYTFDDNTIQLVTVSAGSYTIPTTLNRANIKSIVGSA